MPTDDVEMIRGLILAFRKRRIEPEWDRLNVPDAARYGALWRDLTQLGVTAFGLPAATGGVELDARSRCDILLEIAAASPALAFGLVGHVTALSLLGEASGPSLPPLVAAAAPEERFALVGSVLDRVPGEGFRVVSNGVTTLSGTLRTGLAYPDWIVVPAWEGDLPRLCVLRADDPGAHFSGSTSSHGLGLIPFGDLSLDRCVMRPEQVLAWPASGRAAHEADGLVTAMLAGMAGELADRSMRYALERYQGGKMIHEHDAVQELTGPIELARRTLRTLAIAVLSEERPGDGGTAALAVDLVRQSGLDAVQTFGGYGYMEDYRVERYLRDANTLETHWVHAAARRRAIARARFAELAR